MKNNFEFAAFNLHKKHTNCWFLARKERIKYQFESIIVNSQRRNEGLPTMHCISLLFTITIFNERLAKSC